MSSPSSNAPTQYEFISHTGVDDASAKQKLKTVRSHVMRNYLHQQQQRSGSSKSTARDRHQAKQRVRSSRSASHDTDKSPSPISSIHSHDQVTLGRVGSFNSGLSASTPEPGTAQRSVLGFDYFPQPDVVSCLARLYVSCVAKDRQAGFPQPSFDTLNAKGETMRAVQETLTMCGNDVPETVLFAIGILAYGCGASREWNESLGHVQAMHRLIDARGGIDHMDFELRRVLTCIALHTEAELSLPPQYPLPFYLSAMPFSLAFQDEVQIRAWRTVKRFPKNTSFLFDVVVQLHQLGFAEASEWTHRIDACTISNSYFEAMRSAMLLQTEKPWTGQLQSGIQGQEAAVMFQVWAAGLPIFVDAALRHLRFRHRVQSPRYYHGPIFERIQGILEGEGGYHGWPRGRNLEPVLTTLFYALESCSWDDPWRMWCVDTLRRVVNLLKLRSAKEFRKVLDFFPSTEVHQGMADAVWTELTHEVVLGSTPTYIVREFGPQ